MPHKLSCIVEHDTTTPEAKRTGFTSKKDPGLVAVARQIGRKVDVPLVYFGVVAVVSFYSFGSLSGGVKYPDIGSLTAKKHFLNGGLSR